MEIAFKFISKYLYFSPKKKHFHKDLRSLLLTALMQVSTQFRASPFERALFSALNRVLLIN